ncbi:universal stress protein [Plantactinospora alkalitolerans]|nr:universal stress protein [Plantactinospora alkalitolerans]
MDMPVATPEDEHYGPTEQHLIVERGFDGPRVIMVGIDGSPTSMHAAAYACGMARRQRCRLVVVFVVSPASFVAAVSGVAAEAQENACQELAADLRTEIRLIADEFRVPTTFVTRRGDPYQELRQAADQVRADLVVVGVSAQAGHRFVGSIATRLVRLGRWPVAVVP